MNSRSFQRFKPPSLVSQASASNSQEGHGEGSSKRTASGSGPYGLASAAGAKRRRGLGLGGVVMGGGGRNASFRVNSGDAEEEEDEEEFQPLDASTFKRISRSVEGSDRQRWGEGEEDFVESEEAEIGGESVAQQQQYQTAFPSSSYWKCLYRKPSTRKNKSWENDAVMLVKNGGSLHILRDIDTQKNLAQSSNLANLVLEKTEDENRFFKIGGYEAIIEYEISEADYRQGNCSTPLPASASDRSSQVSRSTSPSKNYVLNHRPIKVAMNAASRQQSGRTLAQPSRALTTPKRENSVVREPLSTRRESTMSTSQSPSVVRKEFQTPRSVDARSFYAKPSSRTELSTPKVAGLMNPGSGSTPKPKFDPVVEGAIVMMRPDEEHQKQFNRRSLPIVDVVLDPVLSSALRPHQVEGVKFLYERVMGMRIDENDESMGAILGDEMGLGKTLQTIALISTLLTQSCYYTPHLRTIDRALIVCPLSLVKNWTREFTKWIGNHKIRVQGVDASDTNVESLLTGRSTQVIIIGYERMRTCIKALTDAQPPFGLVVCDEGHRLKSLQAKTTQMFAGFSCPRRIILTGTPIQNDLSEFYAMFDFVAPGLLGNPKVFKKTIEDPIMRSRQRGARQDVIDRGRELANGLQQIAGKIMLRRTAELLSGFLPPKHELVVFCSPSQLQLDIYKRILDSNMIRDVLGEGNGGGSAATSHLTLIGVLRKLCNTPELLLKDLSDRPNGEQSVTHSLIEDTVDLFPRRNVTNDASLSGKLLCLFRMLKLIRETTTDKVVIVSNFTRTLDVLEAICRKSRYSFVRMDGTTKQSERMSIVSAFNRGSQRENFCFLLSSKTGGTGINLIGANRLILVDSDWNPAVDRQAMARIHRDGQKKHCYIYRLLLAGTMDEKIYERQVSKLGLSDSMIDSGDGSAESAGNGGGTGGGGGGGGKKSSADSFSLEELRDIFRLHLDTPCISHDQLGCSCGGVGVSGAGRKAKDDSDADDEEGNEHDRESAVPQKGFMPASQVAMTQEEESQVDKRAKLAALLDWAHHDFSSLDKFAGRSAVDIEGDKEETDEDEEEEEEEEKEASRSKEEARKEEYAIVEKTNDDVINTIVDQQKQEMIARQEREKKKSDDLDADQAGQKGEKGKKGEKKDLFFSSQSDKVTDDDVEEKHGDKKAPLAKRSFLAELDTIAGGENEQMSEDEASSSDDLDGASRDAKLDGQADPRSFDIQTAGTGAILYVFSKSSKSAIVEGQAKALESGSE